MKEDLGGGSPGIRLELPDSTSASLHRVARVRKESL